MDRTYDGQLIPMGLTATLLLGACSPSDPPSPAPSSQAPKSVGTAPSSTAPAYVEQAESLGLRFTYQSGASEHLHIAEVIGGGAAVMDADLDGDMDLFLPQAGTRNGTAPAGHHVFMQNRLIEDGVVSFQAHPVGPGGYGIGATVGDPNGDGLPDIYVTRHGKDQLWINLGHGRFEEASLAWELSVDGISSAAAFFDLDGDGDEDLYVARYVRPLASPPVCLAPNGQRDYCAPHAWPAAHDVLLRNEGGRFSDVSAEYGIQGQARYSLMVLPWDVDGDGAVDVVVANDAMDNRLWMNRGGQMVDEAPERGIAVNASGMPEASMGVALLDANRDGYVDLLMTHFSGESNTIYLSDAAGYFMDRTFSSGLAGPTLPYTGWGVRPLDANRDGWPDLAFANGRASMGLPKTGEAISAQLAQSNQMFFNQGNGSFVAATGLPTEFGAPLNSRGMVTADFDNNGRVDLLVVNADAPSQLFMDTADPGEWIGLIPTAPQGRPWYRGYWVQVGDTRLYQAPQASYASYSDPRLVMALAPGQDTRVQGRALERNRYHPADVVPVQ